MSEKRIRTPSSKSAEAAMDKRLKDEKDSRARIAQGGAVAAEPPQGLIVELKKSPAGESPAPGLAACPECASSKCGMYFCSNKVYLDFGLPLLLQVTLADYGQDESVLT